MMNNLINDLLDLAKLDNNAFQLSEEKFNLIEVVQNAFSIVSFQAESKQLNLMMVLDSEIKQRFRNVVSDKRRTLQILLNFISNSLKFTSPGG